MDLVRTIRGTGRSGLLLLIIAGLCAALLAASDVPAKPTPTSSGGSVAVKHTPAKKAPTKKGKRSRKSKKASKRGQQAIDSQRTREIQEALIREHYLEGESSGKWDATTQAALRRFQADQGWQTKTVPDSRALIKLGLGPSSDGLLNPESAMTSAPVSASAKSETKSGDVSTPSSNHPAADPQR